MKAVISTALMLFIFLFGTAQTGGTKIKKAGNALNKRSVMLPNGWNLTPAGRSLELGDLPLNIAVSSSGSLMAVTNNGQGRQSLQLIDVGGEKVMHNVEIPKSFYGLKFSKDEKFLYASGGNDNWILQYEIKKGATNKDAAQLSLRDSIKLGERWPEKISPVGIDIDDEKNLLYVVTKENNALYIIDLAIKKVVHKEALSNEAYTCVLSPDAGLLYISLWGGKAVATFDTRTRKLKSSTPVSYNPNEIILTKNGAFLFVANGGDNSVSVINTSTNTVIEVLNTALYPAAPAGSVANGLALSANEKILYVANADNNSLAVFDVSKPGRSRSKGFIPVGWYPTSVRVIDKRIFVANGKGFTSFANPLGPQPVNKNVQSASHQGEVVKANSRLQYIGNLMKGTMSIIDEPEESLLAAYSKQVYANTPYTKEKELQVEGEKGNPIPMKVGDASPIKYVFYILKENRTYDQVFGDMPQGNGDTSLVLFGEKYTPNQHKLAREYVLFDNFYVDAEVSADGHNWSMGAHANDFLEKTWPTNYSRRGGVNDGLGRREVANNKDGFIWDFCKRAG
ncbi:MAG TPA: bifunctional YncE family protein/alkaline phosphatase family protein, partial [Flavisolibacter sp.]|nr:bifunctional YncE family protein/alkaline phosphatase family protein [Flavisolibacter sp.]